MNSAEDLDSPADAFKRRNMLMNIILRPGGGDKSKALPRPKVDVKADGPNVIIIRMTFPDNENIQGLRAFTPTEPEEISQFSAINEILPPNTNVERITAQSEAESEPLIKNPEYPDYYPEESENAIEYEYYYDEEPVPRDERQQPQEAFFAPVTPAPTPVAPLQVSALPTRPQRPFRAPVAPPQPPVLLGAHSHIPPPPSGFQRPIPAPPSPPSPPAPPAPPRPPKPPTIPGGAKRPRLFISSSLTSGQKNFNYNVSVDRRRDKKGIFKGLPGLPQGLPGLPAGLPSLDKQDWKPIFNNA